jgi:hypothetical protein
MIRGPWSEVNSQCKMINLYAKCSIVNVLSPAGAKSVSPGCSPGIVMPRFLISPAGAKSVRKIVTAIVRS